ncbi:MAG: DUF302 domain-containing protein [Kiloniellales bacterium]|nr:DUF302 domain-containing protein [Kiloniellales bacterium]
MHRTIRKSLIVLLFLASPALGAPEALPGWVVMATPHSYQGLIERLDQAVKANKMGLVTRASATTGAKKKLNKTIAGNMVVGVYRPDFAVRMLEASVQAGIEAPIRFYITENDDGTATLSYKTPSAVFAPYRDGGQALVDLAGELDAIFDRIARQAAAP